MKRYLYIFMGLLCAVNFCKGVSAYTKYWMWLLSGLVIDYCIKREHFRGKAVARFPFGVRCVHNENHFDHRVHAQAVKTQLFEIGCGFGKKIFGPWTLIREIVRISLIGVGVTLHSPFIRTELFLFLTSFHQTTS